MFLTEYSVITVPFSDAFYRVLLRFFFSLNPWLTSPFFQVTMISSLASFVDPLFARSHTNGVGGWFSSRVSKFKIHDPISRAETAKTASTTPSTNLAKSSYALGSYINSLGTWYLARVSCSLRFNGVCTCRGAHRSRQTDVVDIENQPFLLSP